MSSPTIKDVARLAGVSISTVSRVMNDSKPVSPEARRKVLDAINKLDFKPNELARSLVMKRSNLIGVVVKDIGISYMAQIIRGIEEIGRMYKFDILLSSTYGDEDQEKKIIDFMITKQVEGIILISEDIKHDVIYKLKNQDVPFIQLDKFNDHEESPTVRINFLEATVKMMKHLYEMGHERILFVKEFENSNTGKSKIEGYRNSMIERDYKLFEIASPGVNIKDGYELGETIWEKIKANDITCVFFAEDDMAVGFINYCYDNGKQVPKDISVAGFGDAPLSSVYRPTITTVQEPFYDIGAVSMRKLVKEIKENDRIVGTSELPSQLMKRESVAKIK